ncbi:MAG TPA: head GIN domain-containing protein [Caldimonas sp.]
MTCTRRPLLVAAIVGLALGPRIARAGDTVRGSGVATTQRREIGAFTGIALGAPVAVVLRAANRESIEIVGDDNILPLIETRLTGSGSGRTLEIVLPRNTRIEPRTPVVVTVDYVHVDALAVGGSGRISSNGMKAGKLAASIGGSGTMTLAGLQADQLDVAVGGSGNVNTDGRARKLSVSIAGSGACEAERLIAGDVAVSMAGSGSARVHAETSLRASIVGNGDVLYSGPATPQASIVGSGRLRRL